MAPTRREFIRSFGVTLASVIVAGCTPAGAVQRSGSGTPPPPAPGQTISPQADPRITEGVPVPTPHQGIEQAVSRRNNLRNSWRQLDWMTQQAREDYNQGIKARDGLIAAHQAVLDELVADGELGAEVAEQVQIAFDAAAYRAWFSGYRVYNICYTPTPSMRPDHTPETYQVPGYALAEYVYTSAYQLGQQADLLIEMAEGGDLDPDVVTHAQAALERDIAFLDLFYDITQAGLERVISPSRLSNEEALALYDEVRGSTNDPTNLPTFDDLQLDVTPETVEAARFLVELLLKEQGWPDRP